MGKQNKKPVIFAFIDASNLMYGSTRVGWKIDYEKLASYLRYRFNVSRLIYLGGVDQKNKKQMGFYKMLEILGFELRLVPVKRFSDGRKKADVDSRLTVEAMKNSVNYDTAVFITGDGDYYWLFEYLLSQKKKINLLGFYHNTAKELKQLFEGNFIGIEDLRKALEFKKNAVDPIVVSTAGIMKKSISKVKNFVKGDTMQYPPQTPKTRPSEVRGCKPPDRGKSSSGVK